jgi:hypothetical protein
MHAAQNFVKNDIWSSNHYSSKAQQMAIKGAGAQGPKFFCKSQVHTVQRHVGPPVLLCQNHSLMVRQHQLHHHHHHHQITKLSHSINAIGPAPHRSGRKREHRSIVIIIKLPN